MKKLFSLFALVLVTLSISAQSVRGDLNGDGAVTTTDVTELYNIIFGTATPHEENLKLKVGCISLNMVPVKGGTFQMGGTPEQGKDVAGNEKPVHSETVGDYYIGETEVTQALWESVMGSNPSNFKGLSRPVENVSWYDCQIFISKLNDLLSSQLPTGYSFRLPTEAEWEYAARGGNKSASYKYCGSNDVDDVAWYKDNSGGETHDVKTKNGNELDIYDMAGNVSEWCTDCWREFYDVSFDTSMRAFRGSSWNHIGRSNRAPYRTGGAPSLTQNTIGLRLVLSDRCVNLVFNVGDVAFTMVAVDGGTFQMGSTSGNSDEQPVHNVTLSDYYIGETEVTQALWESVMGSNPSNFKGINRPVVLVSWDECQEFVNKLNNLFADQLPEGRQFRLPTEAEWEFAARGGTQSTGNLWSGSNNIDDVAWYYHNSYDKGYNDDCTHDVATKTPNELGIYDMSGNAMEWCQDWYGSYSSSAQTNPTGPVSGSDRVLRGGSFDAPDWFCSVSNRFYSNESWPNIGLRLAL